VLDGRGSRLKQAVQDGIDELDTDIEGFKFDDDHILPSADASVKQAAAAALASKSKFVAQRINTVKNLAARIGKSPSSSLLQTEDDRLNEIKLTLEKFATLLSLKRSSSPQPDDYFQALADVQAEGKRVSATYLILKVRLVFQNLATFRQFADMEALLSWESAEATASFVLTLCIHM
jgi:hypothetical protein